MGPIATAIFSCFVVLTAVCQAQTFAGRHSDVSELTESEREFVVSLLDEYRVIGERLSKFDVLVNRERTDADVDSVRMKSTSFRLATDGNRRRITKSEQVVFEEGLNPDAELRRASLSRFGDSAFVDLIESDGKVFFKSNDGVISKKGGAGDVINRAGWCNPFLAAVSDTNSIASGGLIEFRQDNYDALLSRPVAFKRVEDVSGPEELELSFYMGENRGEKIFRDIRFRQQLPISTRHYLINRSGKEILIDEVRTTWKIDKEDDIVVPVGISARFNQDLELELVFKFDWRFSNQVSEATFNPSSLDSSN
jgi:hypothetical protein